MGVRTLQHHFRQGLSSLAWVRLGGYRNTTTTTIMRMMAATSGGEPRHKRRLIGCQTPMQCYKLQAACDPSLGAEGDDTQRASNTHHFRALSNPIFLKVNRFARSVCAPNRPWATQFSVGFTRPPPPRGFEIRCHKSGSCILCSDWTKLHSGAGVLASVLFFCAAFPKQPGGEFGALLERPHPLGQKIETVEKRGVVAVWRSLRGSRWIRFSGR
jgi:hypothetical protein